MATQQLVITQDGKPLVVETPERKGIDPIVLLQQALDKSPEALKLVREFVEWYDATAARKAYVQAMNAFKANPPIIIKNKHVSFQTKNGKADYDHATLDHVCEKIVPALAAVGITHRWETSQSAGIINVTCVLTHELGHSERTTLQGLPDDTGSKNSIQAVGSAVSYLERYTLLAGTGLSAKDQDDDGRGGISAAPEIEGLDDWCVAVRDAHDYDEMQKVYQQAFSQASAMKSQKSKDALIDAREEWRKRQKARPR